MRNDIKASEIEYQANSQNAREDLQKELNALGVSSDESKLYLSLVQNDNVSGYELAKRTGIPSPRIYTILNKLLMKGFIVTSGNRPARYFPCSPEVVCKNLKTQFENSFDRLERGFKRLPETDSLRRGLVWNLTSRKEILAKARDIIRKSTGAAFLAAWPKDLRPIGNGLRTAVKRGIQVKTVTYGVTAFKGGEIFCHRPSDYLFRERRERRFALTADDRIAVIGDFKSDGLGSGLWTESPGLVRIFRDFIIHEIIIILIEAAFPDHIKEVFGRDWENLYSLANKRTTSVCEKVVKPF